MKKIVDYLLSSIYMLYFGLMLVIFHVVQVVVLNLFGKKAHQKSVHVFNFFLLYGTYLLFTKIESSEKQKLPTDRPIIFIANHQSMFDIIGIIWLFRKNFPIFVSKIELSKGVPGVSYNLRHSGAALIDRKDSKQAVAEIAKMGKYIEETKFAAVIFPEGTRSRDGKMKPFAVGGVSVLLKRIPSAIVVPIAIGGTGHFNPKGIFPLTSFSKMYWNSLEIIEPKGKTAEEVVNLAEKAIIDFKAKK